MAYRESAYDERCVLCDALAVTRCARCGDPGCDWHLFTDDRVCGHCHDAYQERLEARRDPRRWTRIVAGVAGTGAIVLAFAGAPIVGFGLVTGAMVLVVVRHRADVKHRRRYLDERRLSRSPRPGRIRS